SVRSGSACSTSLPSTRRGDTCDGASSQIAAPELAGRASVQRLTGNASSSACSSPQTRAEGASVDSAYARHEGSASPDAAHPQQQADFDEDTASVADESTSRSQQQRCAFVCAQYVACVVAQIKSAG